MFKFNNCDNALNGLTSGAFLTAGADKVNVMTIAWGGIGVMWRKNIFICPVRFSRYTMDFIEASGEFCISIPKTGEMTAGLKLCGTKSGRDYNKIADFRTRKCSKIDTLAIDGCAEYYECKVLAKIPLTKEMLGDYALDFYKDGDFHMLYIGEML